jgi:hypothetical protein
MIETDGRVRHWTLNSHSVYVGVKGEHERVLGMMLGFRE